MGIDLDGPVSLFEQKLKSKGFVADLVKQREENKEIDESRSNGWEPPILIKWYSGEYEGEHVSLAVCYSSKTNTVYCVYFKMENLAEEEADRLCGKFNRLALANYPDAEPHLMYLKSCVVNRIESPNGRIAIDADYSLMESERIAEFYFEVQDKLNDAKAKQELNSVSGRKLLER